MNELRESLPFITPLAIEWAERVSAAAAVSSPTLSAGGLEIARRVGVKQPERVRVAVAKELPFPDHPALQAAATQTGLLGPHTAGLTLGYTVFIREGFLDVRLLSHELRHVAQYEEAGSIANFLPLYLAQIAEVGYEAAPFEVDARNHEIPT
jgi:hypothetical protein